MSGDLVKSVSIQNLTQQRAAVLQRIAQALELLGEARTIACAAHLDMPRLEVAPHYRVGSLDVHDPGALDRLRKLLDASGWQYLMRESGMRSFMDANTRERWDQGITSKDVPELTFENVEATFLQLHEKRAEMFEAGVLNVFRCLSHDFKTNSPRLFGKRLILTHLASYTHGLLYFNSGTTDELDDLQRVMHLLDGKPEPDCRQGMRNRIHAVERAGLMEIEDEYLRVRWFKKGTGHVLFKRLDLVEQMNAILAKHYPNALPACDR